MINCPKDFKDIRGKLKDCTGATFLSGVGKPSEVYRQLHKVVIGNGGRRIITPGSEDDYKSAIKRLKK